MSSPADQLGRQGEERAAAHLQAGGWQVLERRFRGRRGEVDLIALRDGVWLFVEVKTSLRRPPRDRVLARQIERVRRGAEEYLQRRGVWEQVLVRFDVIWVWGEDLQLEQLENAF